MSEQFQFEQYDALIFDMDGTLVDSMPLHLDAWEITSAEFGLPFDRAQLNEYGGIPTRNCLMNQQPRVKPAACLTTTAVAASGERIW